MTSSNASSSCSRPIWLPETPAAPSSAPDGSVIAVAVAIAPDRDDVAYALDSASLIEILATAGAEEADTGPCIR